MFSRFEKRLHHPKNPGASSLDGTSNSDAIDTNTPNADSGDSAAAGIHVSASQTISQQSPATNSLSLWEKAYLELQKDEPDLVASFERITALEQQGAQQDNELDRNEPNDRQRTMEQLVNKKIAQMNDRMWRFKIGQRDVEVREKVDQIVRIVMVAKDFVSAAANIDALHAGLPWAGICILLPLLVNDTTQRNEALDGLKYISEVVRRFGEIERLYLSANSSSDGDDLDAAIVRVYRRVLEYEGRALCQFNRNTAVQLARNVVSADKWKTYIENVKSSEADCDKLMRILDAKYQRNRMEVLQSSLDNQNRRMQDLRHESCQRDKANYQQILAELKATREDARDFRRNYDERKVCELLRTSEYEKFKERNPERVPETCLWLLRNPIYLDWEATAMSDTLLWVSANPGCGKSVLAKSLVDNELSSTAARSVCYFFFKDDNDEQRDLSTALCAILHQLYEQRPWLIKHAVSEYHLEGSKLSKLVFKLWNVLVQSSLDPQAGEIVCVLDALDECEESSRREFIKYLAAFFKGQEHHQLKFLITSRPYVEIEREFQSMAKKSSLIRIAGEMEFKTISHEIDVVIKSSIPEIKETFHLSDSELGLLEESLLRVPQRTYIWLKLILGGIKRELSMTKRKIRDIVGTIPKSLDAAYDAILDKSSDFAQAKKLLSIIVSAVRPFTLNEMRLALAVELNSHSYEDIDVEKEITFPVTVRNICGLFVDVIDGKVYLIHHTAKDFLVGQNSVSDSWKASLHPMETEMVLAQICVAFLNFQDFENIEAVTISGNETLSKLQLLLEKTMKPLLKMHSFLDYAARHWFLHFLHSGSRSGHDLTSLVIRICDTKSPRHRAWLYGWMISASPDEQALLHSQDTLTSLLIFSFFNIPVAAKTFLDEIVSSKNENINGSRLHQEPFLNDLGGETALFWAIDRRHPRMLDLLLEYGVSLGSPEIDGRVLLSTAASKGEVDMVKVLIEHGADIESADLGGYPPLAYAIAKGKSVETIEAFLEAGGNLEHSDKSGQTALFWAIKGNDQAILQFLLERGANKDHQDKQGIKPLAFAASAVNAKAVEALLSRNADPNDVDKQGCTVLWHAVNFEVNPEHGTHLFRPSKLRGVDRAAASVEILAMLLAHGANLELENRNEETPLSRCAVNLNLEGARFLLEKGASPTHVDRMQRTPLLLACLSKPGIQPSNDATGLIELFLSHGVDIEQRDHEGCTALALALSNGHFDASSALLKHGANLETRDNDMLTPLAKAACQGADEIVDFLLDNKADIETTDQEGLTPLALSVMHCEVSVRFGPRIDAFMDYIFLGGSLLRLGDKFGFREQTSHCKAAELLLRRGASRNIQVANGASRVSCHNHEMANILRLWQVDVSLPDEEIEKEIEDSIRNLWAEKIMEGCEDFDDLLECASHRELEARLRALYVPRMAITAGSQLQERTNGSKSGQSKETTELLQRKSAKERFKNILSEKHMMKGFVSQRPTGHETGIPYNFRRPLSELRASFELPFPPSFLSSSPSSFLSSSPSSFPPSFPPPPPFPPPPFDFPLPFFHPPFFGSEVSDSCSDSTTSPLDEEK